MSTSITKNFPVGQVHLLGFPPSSKVPTVGTLLVSHILEYDFYIHIWSRKSTRPFHWFPMRFSPVTIFSTLTWWCLNWRWHHSLPWEGWHHLSYQIRKHQGRFRTSFTSDISLPQIYNSCTFSTEYWDLLFPHHLQAICPLHLVVTGPPTSLLAVSELPSFNHPIFWLVIPLITSLLVSFPYFTPPGPVIPAIPVLSNIP